MNESSVFRSILIGLPPSRTIERTRRAEPTEVPDYPTAILSRAQPTWEEARPWSGSPEHTATHLGDQLAHDVAVFPSTGRVAVNEQGVFVPRSLFGHNAEIRQDVKRLPDGTTRVSIFSVLTAGKGSKLPIRLDCTLELQWLAEHRREYAGQWVALDGGRLLASGANPKEVRDTARKSGVEIPLIVQVESPDELPFGGW